MTDKVYVVKINKVNYAATYEAAQSNKGLRACL